MIHFPEKVILVANYTKSNVSRAIQETWLPDRTDGTNRNRPPAAQTNPFVNRPQVPSLKNRFR